MVNKDLHWQQQRSFHLFSLCCLSFASSLSLFLLLSISRKASISSSTTHPQFLHFKPIDANPTTRSNPSATGDSSCDYSDGSWVYYPNAGFDRYDSSCKGIFKGWNCILNNKSNGRDIIKWRWKPRNCDLPPFDPLQFLHSYRGTNNGSIGDSLNRNMFVSLFCTLKRVSNDVKKWRPAGVDRGFTFLHYNLTIGDFRHRSNKHGKRRKCFLHKQTEPYL